MPWAVPEWENLGQPASGPVNSGPGVSSWGPGRLDLFVRTPHNQMGHRWYNGIWHLWEDWGGSLLFAPSATSRGPGSIDIFARHLPDAHVVYRGMLNNQIQPWRDLGDWHIMSDPVVTHVGSHRLDVFALNGDLAVLHAFWDSERGGRWSNWEQVGGGAWSTSRPGAVSWGQGRLDVFVRGQDGNLHHNWTV